VDDPASDIFRLATLFARLRFYNSPRHLCHSLAPTAHFTDWEETMSITAVEAVPISGAVRRDLAIISSLGEHIAGQYVLVRVHDDSGKTGLGEASVTSVWSGETQAGAPALLENVLAPLVIGADPFDIEWISRRMDHAAFGNSFAKAAIEMALLDLQGQVLCVPVYKLLGGREPDAQARGIRLKFVVG